MEYEVLILYKQYLSARRNIDIKDEMLLPVVSTLLTICMLKHRSSPNLLKTKSCINFLMHLKCS